MFKESPGDKQLLRFEQRLSIHTMKYIALMIARTRLDNVTLSRNLYYICLFEFFQNGLETNDEMVKLQCFTI